jgi:hypothetical protein
MSLQIVGGQQLLNSKITHPIMYFIRINEKL